MAKNITIIRGNSQHLTLTISPTSLQPGDVVYFTAKAKYDNDETDSLAVISKDVTSNAIVGQDPLVFELTPQETDVIPGKYVYDITAKFSGNRRITLLSGKLTVKPVATLRGI